MYTPVKLFKLLLKRFSDTFKFFFVNVREVCGAVAPTLKFENGSGEQVCYVREHDPHRQVSSRQLHYLVCINPHAPYRCSARGRFVAVSSLRKNRKGTDSISRRGDLLR